ncbi:hypothetical protein MIDIC_230067 [Alphaproteobacteria bacterium]
MSNKLASDVLLGKRLNSQNFLVGFLNVVDKVVKIIDYILLFLSFFCIL